MSVSCVGVEWRKQVYRPCKRIRNKGVGLLISFRTKFGSNGIVVRARTHWIMRNSALCVDALLSVGHSQGNGYVGMQGRIGSGFIAIGWQPFLSSVYIWLAACVHIQLFKTLSVTVIWSNESQWRTTSIHTGHTMLSRQAYNDCNAPLQLASIYTHDTHCAMYKSVCRACFFQWRDTYEEVIKFAQAKYVSWTVLN